MLLVGGGVGWLADLIMRGSGYGVIGDITICVCKLRSRL